MAEIAVFYVAVFAVFYFTANTRLKRELRDTKDALEILKKAISILGN